MRTIKYLVALLLLTIYHASRVVWASLRGRPSHSDVYDDAPRSWGRSLLAVAGIPVTVEGLERVDWSRPYVIASNHQSFVDIWVFAAKLPGRIRFVSKKELRRVPLFGHAMEASGHIFIDRRNRVAAFSVYDAAAKQIRSGTSAVVFVEGTRSRDGTLQAFKKGPFVLAIAAGVPVLPVYVAGTHAVLPRGACIPRPGPVTLRVGEPIPTDGLSYEDRDALTRRCREAIVALAGRGVDGVAVGG